MPTIATIFSGGEGVGVGAKNAGYTHLWGIELENDIAQVARDNGFNTLTGDIFEIDAATLDSPDVLHASPECQRASVANSQRGETVLDIALGKRVEYYLETLRPKVFTLENVRPYKHFEAFKSIVAKLFDLGYMADFQNLCAADFGVPQTRHRLILRASRIGLLPILPPREKWIGWYEAIEDLIPTLPGDKFAPWQLKRLEKMDLQSLLVGCRSKGAEWSNDIKSENEPAQTVNAHTMQTKAFIVDDKQGTILEDSTRAVSARELSRPVFTIQTSQPLRAFIVDGTSNDNGQDMTAIDGENPIFTITASSYKRPLRAWLSQGRVVSMTPRALARFQSFPDWYVLPDTKTLACKIIGNAVPCLMYQKIIEQFKGML